MNYEKSCGAIIIDDDKVLLIKQGNGDWGFPMGLLCVVSAMPETLS